MFKTCGSTRLLETGVVYENICYDELYKHSIPLRVSVRNPA